MNIEYHLQEDDGSYSPVIIDLRFDSDMAPDPIRRSPRAWVRAFAKRQAAERILLIATGKIVRDWKGDYQPGEIKELSQKAGGDKANGTIFFGQISASPRMSNADSLAFGELLDKHLPGAGRIWWP